MPKLKQWVTRNFQDAQLLASGVRSIAGFETYSVSDGVIPSSLGMWNDRGYVLTDAPATVVRKAAKMHHIERVELTRVRKNPALTVFANPGRRLPSVIARIRGHRGDIARAAYKNALREYGDEGKAIATALAASQGRRQVRRQTRRNPPRGAIQLSQRVFSVAYKHLEDGKDYKHDFKSGVCLELLRDGSIRIYSMSGKRLWGDF